MIPKDLMGAAITPLILSILEDADSYGYRMIQRVRTLSMGQIELEEGVLYPLLHRMEKKGWIRGYWERSSGRRRKFYRLKNSGLRRLKEYRDHWDRLSSIIRNLDQLDTSANEKTG